MDWELFILVCGAVAEIAIILLLIRGRVYRTLPAFFLYLCWSLFSDWFLYYIRTSFPPQSFLHIYFAQLVLDSALIFVVLVEVTWSILRPIRNALPRYSWVGIAVLIAIGGLILWPIAGFTAQEQFSPASRNLFLLQQTVAILRAVYFLGLVAFSQLLSIGWRDRELQIATGLGFYSIVSLTVTVIHTHQTAAVGQTQWIVRYHWLDLVVAFSYLAALIYWVFAFATKPAERREFTPQMQNMLLAVAGAARSTRAGLTGSKSDKSGN